MNRGLVVLFLSFIFWLQLLGQKDSLQTFKVERTNINYNSYVVSGDTLYSINDSGIVVIWDLKKVDTLKMIKPESGVNFTAISLDRNKKVVVGCSDGSIYRFKEVEFQLELIQKIKYHVWDLCFTEENKLFTVIPYAIYDPEKKKMWYKFRNYHAQIVWRRRYLKFFWIKTEAYFTLPDYSFLDSKGRWWLLTDYGEWGTSINIFDTENEEIYSETIDSLNEIYVDPQNLLEDGHRNLIISTGHGFYDKLYQLDTNNQFSLLVDSIYPRPIVKPTTYVELSEDGVITITAETLVIPRSTHDKYIGPCAYNEEDNSIFLCLTDGIYQMPLNHSSQIHTLKFVFNPNIKNHLGMELFGSPIYFKDIQVIKNNKLLFLTRNNGFGIYDGKLTRFK